MPNGISRAGWGQGYTGDTQLPSVNGTTTDTPVGEYPGFDLIQSPEQLWNIPDTQMIMPTTDWWENISPQVMAGLEAPWNRAQSQMFETLGAGGQLGSAEGGFSGAAGAALGEFSAQKAQGIGQQAWGMTQPGLQAGWQAQLQQNQFPYSLLSGMLGSSLPTPVVSQGGDSFMENIMPVIIMAASAYAASDIRLKKNIRKVGTYKSFDVIEFEYLWGGGTQRGLIAQQVQKVNPGAVRELNGYLYINYAVV